jgi:zinc protease
MLFGRSSVSDIETAFQLMWLTFTQPRFDADAFEVWRSRTDILNRNQLNQPQFAHSQAQVHLQYNRHPRILLYPTAEELMSVDHKTAFDFFRSRFDSATDFDFVFVGDISKESLHALIESYIAPLTRNRRVNSQIIDRGIRFNLDAATEYIYMGNQMTIMRLTFTSPFPGDTNERRIFNSASTLLYDMLMHSVREDISGVYFIAAIPGVDLIPYPQASLHVHLFCDAERVEEIEIAILETIQSIKDNTFEDSFLQSFRVTNRQRRDNSLTTNTFWLNSLLDGVIFEGISVEESLGAGDFIQNIPREEMSRVMREYIDFDRMQRVILFPESMRPE